MLPQVTTLIHIPYLLDFAPVDLLGSSPVIIKMRILEGTSNNAMNVWTNILVI